MLNGGTRLVGVLDRKWARSVRLEPTPILNPIFLFLGIAFLFPEFWSFFFLKCSLSAQWFPNHFGFHFVPSDENVAVFPSRDKFLLPPSFFFSAQFLVGRPSLLCCFVLLSRCEKLPSSPTVAPPMVIVALVVVLPMVVFRPAKFLGHAKGCLSRTEQFGRVVAAVNLFLLRRR